MWSSRKYSVKRHIQSKHNGYGTIVSFIDYIVGRKTGFYPTSSPPFFTKKENKDENKSLLDIVSEEYWKEFSRQAVRKKFQV
jgi:hypothetical protein